MRLRLLLVILALFVTAMLPAGAEAAANPKIGVLISQQTMDFGSFTADKKGIKINKVSLAARQDVTFRLYMERGYAPKDLSDADLRSPKAIGGLDVIVLPYTLVMDGKQAQVLRDFVYSGGGLVAIYQAPRLNGNGDPWSSVMKGAWGPLTAVYQLGSFPDMAVPGYRVTAIGRHPILSRARAALDRPLVLEAWSRQAVLEKTAPLTGAKTKRILSFTRGSPGAWAGRYGKGRYVYFGFPAMDFVWFRELRLRKNQGKVAEELLVQSALWSAGR